MARFVSRTFRGQGRVAPRRATQWLGSTDETAMTQLAAGTTILDQSLAFAEPATIVRTRGGILLISDQAASAEQAHGALGMLVLSDEALAIGVTAVPKPMTNNDSDLWFLWEPWAIGLTPASDVDVGSNWISFDSKAQRKVNDGTSVAVVIENQSSAFGCQYLIQFRMLLKLHG